MHSVHCSVLLHTATVNTALLPNSTKMQHMAERFHCEMSSSVFSITQVYLQESTEDGCTTIICDNI